MNSRAVGRNARKREEWERMVKSKKRQVERNGCREQMMKERSKEKCISGISEWDNYVHLEI